MIEGTSVYYLRFEGESGFSVYVSAAQVPEAPLLNVGDTVTVYWNERHPVDHRTEDHSGEPGRVHTAGDTG